MAASPLAALLPAERDRAGRVLVEPNPTIKHHRDVFVIDDLASVQQDGKPVPRIAPAAKQMGAYVAMLIRSRIANENRSVRESDVANASAANQKQTPEPRRLPAPWKSCQSSCPPT